ncbi:MAG: DUF2157 domain-containing protein [Proteobacteria bacterium]|nr:DUF2157 domain-containing protein [Pseudomonadota bacterium]
MLNDLERAGLLTRGQGELLRRIYGREFLSVYWELRVLLYAGILTLTTGLGLLIRTHFESLGHLALLGAIALGCAACFAYCLRRGGGFSQEAVPAPDTAYDYVLFLGCLLLGTGAGYLELRYQVLARHWSWWLLGSGLFYLLSAHYFDSRLVLSLALSTLGAWLGVETSLLAAGSWDAAVRVNALVFGAAVVLAGIAQAGTGWKRHFLAVHLHLGLNVLLAALVSGIERRAGGVPYLLGLLAVAVGSALYAQRARRFAFLLYAVLYGYVGVTVFVLEHGRWQAEAVLLYFLVTASAVLAALVAFHRRFRSAE